MNQKANSSVQNSNKEQKQAQKQKLTQTLKQKQVFNKQSQKISEQDLNIKYFNQLKVYKSLLFSAKNSIEFLTTLQKINTLLQLYRNPLFKNIHQLLYEVLKPITRQITNSSLKNIQAVTLMQEVLKKIIILYTWMFRTYDSASCAENIKELLQRECSLFVKRSKMQQEQQNLFVKSEDKKHFQQDKYKTAAANPLLAMRGNRFRLHSGGSKMKRHDIYKKYQKIYPTRTIKQKKKLILPDCQDDDDNEEDSDFVPPQQKKSEKKQKQQNQQIVQEQPALQNSIKQKNNQQQDSKNSYRNSNQLNSSQSSVQNSYSATPTFQLNKNYQQSQSIGQETKRLLQKQNKHKCELQPDNQMIEAQPQLSAQLNKLPSQKSKSKQNIMQIQNNDNNNQINNQEIQQKISTSSENKQKSKKQLSQDQLYPLNKLTTLEKYKWQLKTFNEKQYTLFYKKCVQIVMLSLQGIQKEFKLLKLHTISQYYHLLHYLQDYFEINYFTPLVIQGITKLTDIFKNPSKDFLKQVSKDQLDTLCQALSKIIRFESDFSLKKQIQLIGPNLAIHLLKHHSIERRMLGVKLLSSYTSAISSRYSGFFNDGQFCKWMIQNQVFQKIYTPDAQLQFLRQSQPLFKIYIKSKGMQQKNFDIIFNLLDMTQKQTRKYIYKLLDNVYIYLENKHYDIILKILQDVKKPQYYQLQFWSFFESLSKYMSQTQMKKSLQLLQLYSTKLYDSFGYNIQGKCDHVFSFVYSKLLEKSKDPVNCIQLYMKMLQNFYENPCQRTILRLKNVLNVQDYQNERSKVSKKAIVSMIIDQKGFFDKIPLLFQKDYMLKIRCNDLINFLLNNYDKKHSKLKPETIIGLAKYKDIFSQLVNLLGQHKSQCLKSLVQKLKTEQVNFSSIKQVFFLVNNKYFIKIDKQYGQTQYQVDKSPYQMQSIQLLFQILETTSYQKVRQQCAQFIAFLFTCYSLTIIQQAKKIKIQFLKSTIDKTMEFYYLYLNAIKDLQKQKQQKEQQKNQIKLPSEEIVNLQQKKNKLQGYLCLIQYLIGYTDYFGVLQFKYKPHNSLVSTDTILLKIHDKCSNNNYKIIQKKYPSNTILFDVIQQCGRQYQMPPYQIILKSSKQKTNSFKQHGMTLQEIGFVNGSQIYALKNFRKRIEKYPLIQKISKSILIPSQDLPQQLQSKQKKNKNIIQIQPKQQKNVIRKDKIQTQQKQFNIEQQNKVQKQQQFQQWLSDKQTQKNQNQKNNLKYKELKEQQKKQKTKIIDSSQKMIAQQLQPQYQQVLTQRARSVFKEMYHRFAKQNKMGKQQIQRFILEVTGNSFSQKHKVQSFLKQWSSDKQKKNISESDFVRFYEKCSKGKKQHENVWKNLQRIGYRQDLKKINDPIKYMDYQESMRYCLANNNHFYDMLFNLIALQQEKNFQNLQKIEKLISSHPAFLSQSISLLLQSQSLLQKKCKKLLNILPTCSIVVQQFNLSFKMLGQNAFKTQYFLIALQSYLSKNHQKYEENIAKFTQGNYYLKIYDYIGSLVAGTEKSHQKMEQQTDQKNKKKQKKDDKKCISIAVHLLRSLIDLPFLGKQLPKQIVSINFFDKLIFLPQNQFLNFLALEALKSQDFELYECLMVLLLTQIATTQNSEKIYQKDLFLKWIKNGVFHKQNIFRKISCNFLQLWNHLQLQIYKKTKSFNAQREFVNLFEIEQETQCNQWFNLLTKTILNKNKDGCINVQDIFESRLQKISKVQQDLYNIMIYNPILNGNLRVLEALIQRVSGINYNLVTDYSNKSLQKDCQIVQTQKNQNLNTEQKQQKNPPSYQNTNQNLKRQPLIIPFHMQQTLINLLDHTVSSENRKSLYHLLAFCDPFKCFKYMNSMIGSIQPNKQVSKKEYFVGIKNLGSICYMNSILQQFFVVQEFRDLILSLKCDYKQMEQLKSQVNGRQIVDDFLYQFQKLYAYLMLSQKKFYNPIQFCLTIKNPQTGQPINTAIQEDAHQFLNLLFDKLQRYLKIDRKNSIIELQDQFEEIEQDMPVKKSKSNEQNQIKLSPNEKRFNKVFGGKTINLITCKTCNNQIRRKQNITHLTVQVKNMPTLHDSLKKLTHAEQIMEFNCQVCGKKVPKTTMQTFLHQLPQILIINLQRIIFDLTTFANDKVHTKLQFPHILQLSEFIKNQQNKQKIEYQLQGVVIHSGTSQSGHYYSLIKVNGKWYKFNDQTVTQFNVQLLANQAFGGYESTSFNAFETLSSKYSTNAYILFYKKIHNAEKTEYKLQKQNIKMIPELKIPFQDQVSLQNKKFYKQFQLHQDSFFQFIDQYYKKIKPYMLNNALSQSSFIQNWQVLPLSKQYSQLLTLQLKAMKFIPIYYQFKDSIFYGIGQGIYQLFSLVPERIYNFLINEVQIEKYLEIMIAHNNTSVRQIYKCVMGRALHIYCTYNGFSYKNVQKISPEKYNKQKAEDYLQRSQKSLQINENIEIDYQKHKQSASNSFNDHNYRQQSSEMQNQNNNYEDQMIPQQPQIKQENLLEKYKQKKSKQNQKQSQKQNQTQIQRQRQKQYQQAKITIQQQDTDQCNQKVVQILKSLVKTVNSQLVRKNIFKVKQYFDLIDCLSSWSISIPKIADFLIDNKLLQLLMDIIMGPDSPYAKPSQKRADFPNRQAQPIINAITKLQFLKETFVQNQKNFGVKYPMTQKQKYFLSSPFFYKKILKQKYDQGRMDRIITSLSIDNRKFSQMITQVLLTSLSNLESYQAIIPIFHHIKKLLLIQDSLTFCRLKWLLGIAQRAQLSNRSYAMKYFLNSQVVNYVSPLFFVQQQSYQPLLHRLYNLIDRFDQMAIKGIQSIIQVMSQSDIVFDYILSIQPPTYEMSCYYDWIKSYIKRFISFSHSSIDKQKKNAIAKQTQYWLINIQKKIKEHQRQKNFPVIKQIIGKNYKQPQSKWIKYLEDQYFIEVFAHNTYVLPNRPSSQKYQKYQNQKQKQKEDQKLTLTNNLLFQQKQKYDQTLPYKRFFIDHYSLSNSQRYNRIYSQVQKSLQKKLTLFTFVINAKKRLKLEFLSQKFQQEIIVPAGNIDINMPYVQKNIDQFLIITTLQDFSHNRQNNKMKMDDELQQQMNQTLGNQGSNQSQQNKDQKQKKFGEAADNSFNNDIKIQMPSNSQQQRAGFSLIKINQAGYDQSENSCHQIQCNVCTYLNYSQLNECQMCNNSLKSQR